MTASFPKEDMEAADVSTVPFCFNESITGSFNFSEGMHALFKRL